MKKSSSLFLFAILFFVSFNALAKDSGKVYETATVTQAKHEMVDAGYVGGYGYARPVQFAVFTGVLKTAHDTYKIQYVAQSRWSYIPQWDRGNKLQVRVKGNKLYVKREDKPNSEVKTEIIQGGGVANTLGQKLEKYQRH